jgi:hypothetical protein
MGREIHQSVLGKAAVENQSSPFCQKIVDLESCVRMGEAVIWCLMLDRPPSEGKNWNHSVDCVQWYVRL